MNGHSLNAHFKWAVACIVLMLPLFLSQFFITLMNDIGLGALVAMGLILLTGIGGITSFGQAAFVGIAAYATGWITTVQHFSPWVGLLFSLSLTTACAYLIGTFTLRLKGHYLPLSTIAWSLSIVLLFGNLDTLGRHSGLSNIPFIEIGNLTLNNASSIYYLIWGIVGLCYWFSIQLLDSRIGRVIRSLRGGPILLASVGADGFVVRRQLFMLAAFYAALSGWLYAHVYRFVSPSPFDVRSSIDFLLMAVVGGLGHLSGAILGSAFVLLIKNLLQDTLPSLTNSSGQIEAIVFSVIFIGLLHFAKSGILGFWSKIGLPVSIADNSKKINGLHEVAPIVKRVINAEGYGDLILSVTDVSKNFGGLVAVSSVSFDVKTGEILGLIGPNGAGKSTLFNLLTGVLSKTSGEVVFNGKNITQLNQRDIAKLGIARTFQHVKLRPHMSLIDNVALGVNLRSRAGFFASGFGFNRVEESQIFLEAQLQLERIGLLDQAHDLAGNLPLGSQRKLEIARALSNDPLLLILDEPAAGLRKQEKNELKELLLNLKKQGVTILIVEHDMDFVMTLVDRLVVMNFGSKIAEGSPKNIRENLLVQQAYLGDDS
jgi:branched-chain amino acid transport system permease protein